MKLVNFEDAQAFKNAVAGSDVVFCAIGTTQKNVKGDKDLYRKIDYDIPVNAAQYCKETGCEKFIVVSAVGASNKSSNFYLRLKGEMEDAVSALGFETLVIARPSLLAGDRHALKQPERAVEKLSLIAFTWFKPLIPANYRAIDASSVAEAMVSTLHTAGAGKHVLLSGDMQK